MSELTEATQAYEDHLVSERIAARHIEAISSEAQTAFDYEVLPKIIRPILESCQDEVMQVMRGIQNGQFPKPQQSYGVLRHQPLSMREDQFLKELMKAYLRWGGRRALKGVVDSSRV